MSALTLADDPAGILLVVGLTAAAAYRIARLIAVDAITLPIRETIWRWAYSDDDTVEARGVARTYLYDFVTCQHCLGVWAAVGITAAWVNSPAVFWPVVAAAAAGVQSVVVARIGD